MKYKGLLLLFNETRSTGHTCLVPAPRLDLIADNPPLHKPLKLQSSQALSFGLRMDSRVRSVIVRSFVRSVELPNLILCYFCLAFWMALGSMVWSPLSELKMSTNFLPLRAGCFREHGPVIRSSLHLMVEVKYRLRFSPSDQFALHFEDQNLVLVLGRKCLGLSASGSRKVLP